MIDLTLYDRHRREIGPLGMFSSAELILRHNALGQLTVTASLADPRIPQAMDQGAMVVADMALPGGLTRRLFSGRMVEAKGKGPSISGQAQLTFVEDKDIVNRLLLWPNPDKAITAQTSQQRTITGPAETVVKTLIRENLVHFLAGSPERVVVAPDRGRGGTITVQARMQYLADVALPKLTAAGIGLSVLQDDAGQLVVDVYESGTFPHEISELGGSLSAWEYTVTAPQASAVVIPNAPADPSTPPTSFYAPTPGSLVDDQESAWGARWEKYVESPGMDIPLSAVAITTLMEGASRWGVSVEVSEGQTFRFGDNVWLGDLVEVELAGRGVMSQPLLEVKLAASNGIGRTGLPEWSTTPVVGEMTTGSRRVYQLMASILRQLNRRF